MDKDKISQLVKTEIQARFQSDIKLKNLTGIIFENI